MRHGSAWLTLHEQTVTATSQRLAKIMVHDENTSYFHATGIFLNDCVGTTKLGEAGYGVDLADAYELSGSERVQRGLMGGGQLTLTIAGGASTISSLRAGYQGTGISQLATWMTTYKGTGLQYTGTGVSLGALDMFPGGPNPYVSMTQVPSTFARVVPGTLSPTTLGVTDRVFVTDALSLRGLSAGQIADQLEIPAGASFKIIEFDSAGISGIATPIRSASPGFVGRRIHFGRIAGVHNP